MIEAETPETIGRFAPMKYARVPAIVVRVASRKYGAFTMSTSVTFLPATFRGIKKSVTLDMACFLLDPCQFYPESDISNSAKLNRYGSDVVIRICINHYLHAVR